MPEQSTSPSKGGGVDLSEVDVADLCDEVDRRILAGEINIDQFKHIHDIHHYTVDPLEYRNADACHMSTHNNKPPPKVTVRALFFSRVFTLHLFRSQSRRLACGSSRINQKWVLSARYF
jgi:hypothetical protein